MNYYHQKKISVNTFEEAVDKVTEALKEQGFGVVTTIDFKETFKKKIGKDFRKYMVLGACHPTSAHQAIAAEQKVGLFLPCNVLLEETQEGTVEVAAVDPIASMQVIENEDLKVIAKEIQAKLVRVMESLV
jgi:uncharacterized protein (DUF302 family)